MRFNDALIAGDHERLGKVFYVIKEHFLSRARGVASESSPK